MTLPAFDRDAETAVGAHATQGQANQPALAGIVGQPGGTPGVTAEMQAVERRPAARFEIRLIPHHGKIRASTMKSKPSGDNTGWRNDVAPLSPKPQAASAARAETGHALLGVSPLPKVRH